MADAFDRLIIISKIVCVVHFVLVLLSLESFVFVTLSRAMRLWKFMLIAENRFREIQDFKSKRRP